MVFLAPPSLLVTTALWVFFFLSNTGFKRPWFYSPPPPLSWKHTSFWLASQLLLFKHSLPPPTTLPLLFGSFILALFLTFYTWLPPQRGSNFSTERLSCTPEPFSLFSQAASPGFFPLFPPSMKSGCFDFVPLPPGTNCSPFHLRARKVSFDLFIFLTLRSRAGSALVTCLRGEADLIARD